MATLPRNTANETLNEGQTFTITGANFNLWPSDIVVGYSMGVVQSGVEPAQLMVLTSKTPTQMVFRVQKTHTYGVARMWNIFGSPNNPPRTILTYGEM